MTQERIINLRNKLEEFFNLYYEVSSSGLSVSERVERLEKISNIIYPIALELWNETSSQEVGSNVGEELARMFFEGMNNES